MNYVLIEPAVSYADAIALCVDAWGPPTWPDRSGLPRAAWSWGHGTSRVMVSADRGRVQLEVTDDEGSDDDPQGEVWSVGGRVASWDPPAKPLAEALASVRLFMRSRYDDPRRSP